VFVNAAPRAGLPNLQPGAADSPDLEDLIRKGASEKVELAIWKRSFPSEVRSAFDRLSFGHFRNFRADGCAASVGSGFEGHVRRAGWGLDVCAALSRDVNAVLQASEARAKGSGYTIRLEHITDDACCRFHKDNTDFRIVATYLGRGTQWASAQDGVLGEVRELNRFDVGLFLGERARRRATILHRSPPVRSQAEQRLLLVIDVERRAWRARQA